jgi:hypothetical protein
MLVCEIHNILEEYLTGIYIQKDFSHASYHYCYFYHLKDLEEWVVENPSWCERWLKQLLKSAQYVHIVLNILRI